MRILGLIPARGGSKGIPRKNIRSIAGKPLIAWTIDAARRSEFLSRVVVSTDDHEIADVAKQFGADVPFMRPAGFATDESSATETLLHALDQLSDYDAVILLQPTSPLRTTSDIDGCIALAIENNAASVVSVTDSPSPPSWTYRLTDSGCLDPVMGRFESVRRQDLEPCFILNGALYFTTSARFRLRHSFLDSDTMAFLMPLSRSVDIDTELDWRIAEMLLKDNR